MRHLLEIRRDGDDHYVSWVFDRMVNLLLARALCREYNATIVEDRPLLGESESYGGANDWYELENWLSFAYITGDEHEDAEAESLDCGA